MNNPEAEKELLHLLERNRETELSYLKAVEYIEDPELKDRFAVFAHQRFAFSLDLKKCMMDFGRSGSIASRITCGLHQKWIALVGTLRRNSDNGIIDRFIEGEKRALDDYYCILQQSSIEGALRRTLNRHYKRIAHSIRILHSLHKKKATANL